jgi:hypothetical protein
LKEHLPTLINYESSEGYIEVFHEAQAKYQEVWIDRPRDMPDYQTAIVFKPSTFNLEDIYAGCIAVCVASEIQGLLSKITNYKTNSAKSKKLEDLLIYIDRVLEELNLYCLTSPRYESVVSMILKIKNENIQTQLLTCN